MTETPHTTKRQDYSLLLQPLIDLPKVRHVVVASSDGMLVAASPNLDVGLAEGIAAMSSSGVSAMRAMANSALEADTAANAIETITTVTALGMCIMVPAAANALLIVVGERDMQMGVVISTAARQARKLGEKVISLPARDAGDPRS
ncbi:roadblock/LC7 domain-containing protein [Streptomyces acidiscabies]|uniref:Roadblock/LC7 domain-containing protein n=1 Tax=Streptomyces acidiscabies TaxID=42234 RepID=A0ABU4MBW5_9ACTN|nr:roadblock/LC7 domain-containing protein [Streptomyces acidiscabies]MDX3024945.1 roadblock/LC7 domain-containing protein [Streptomyces acidiscabies]